MTDREDDVGHNPREEYFNDWFSDNKESLKDKFFEDQKDKLFKKWLEDNEEDLKQQFFDDDGTNDEFLKFARDEMRWEN